MDQTKNCKDRWANIFFYTFFSFFFFFFLCMTENSEASTTLLSQESAMAKMRSLFLGLEEIQQTRQSQRPFII